MAYFYDTDGSDQQREDPGSFNVELLLAIRKTLIHLDGNMKENKLNLDIMDFISSSVIFDFPDDEVG